jgi:peroxiredoxin
MSALDRPLELGDVLPDVPLENWEGETARLSSLRGRALLVVCVRYYG